MSIRVEKKNDGDEDLWYLMGTGDTWLSTDADNYNRLSEDDYLNGRDMEVLKEYFREEIIEEYKESIKHPDWWGAKPGEIWEVKRGGLTTYAIVTVSAGGNTYFIRPGASNASEVFPLRDGHVQEARKVDLNSTQLINATKMEY